MDGKARRADAASIDAALMIGPSGFTGGTNATDLSVVGGGVVVKSAMRAYSWRGSCLSVLERNGRSADSVTVPPVS